jgi:hypothetical protein
MFWGTTDCRGYLVIGVDLVEVFRMINTMALDHIIRQTALIDATDGMTGDPGRSEQEVLRSWLNNSEALARVLPLILVLYRVVIRNSRGQSVDRSRSRFPSYFSTLLGRHKID